MGNLQDPMKDGESDDSSDEEFAYDTLARDITYTRCTSKTSPATKPARSISIKRSDSSRGRSKVVRSTSSRRKSSFKASSRRSPNKSSLYKARRDNKLYLSDMEIRVEDGKVAKLVPRESVLEKKGMNPVKAKLKSMRKESPKKQHLHFTITQKEAIKIGPMKLRPPPKLELSRKSSYGAAISNNNNVNDIVSAIAKESDATTQKKNLQGSESFNIAINNGKPATADGSNKAHKSRSKSMYLNSNNNSTITDIEASIGKLTVTTSITEV